MFPPFTVMLVQVPEGGKRFHLLSAEGKSAWGAKCWMPEEFPYLVGFPEEKTVVCRCAMDLHTFPFDSQSLRA